MAIRSIQAVVAVLASAAALAQPVDTVRVIARQAGRTVKLPGELLPYRQVDLHARVTGYLEALTVDRGSVVRKGQVLATLAAPEMEAQLGEARSRVQAAESQKAEAQAGLVAAQATLARLKEAAATPGAVAPNEITLAEMAVDTARARVGAAEGAIRAAQAQVKMTRDLMAYLEVRAPFDGVITERLVDPGALVGPGAGAADPPLLRLQQVARLRLVVALPEADVASIPRAARVPFRVPAWPGQTFTGVVARVARSLEPRTRTMPVELEVDNARGLLAPGMYPEVDWPVERAAPSLLVPPSAVLTTTERSFVIRLRDHQAEWVDVRKGAKVGDLVEVMGPLKEGDELVRRASDEIREGTRLETRSGR